MDIKQFLKTLPAFEAFSEAQLGALSELMTVSSQPDGHAFITQGQQGDALYLLMEGAIQTLRIDDVTGQQEEGRDLHAGEMFGLLSLIEDMPATSACIAEGAVTVAALPLSGFKRLYEVAPPIAHHLQYMVAVELARNLQERNKELRELMRKRAA